jgi:hypothetical protein
MKSMKVAREKKREISLKASAILDSVHVKLIII